MNNTLFELADGRQFYYNSELNICYNTGGEQLSLPPEMHLEWYEEEKTHHGVDTKVNNPVAIRLLLGHACNYSCSYCMQKDIGNPNERPESFHLESFIEAVQNNLDLSRLKRVELWGGEPFLYWKDMVRIMEMVDAPEREYFISTNGSPFVQKHVDFFAKLKGTVLINVSHDGPGQESLRGEDILKNPKKVDIIRQLIALPNVQVGFGSVISATNYNLFEINDFFKNNFGDVKLTFIPVKNYDETNSQNSAIHMLRGDKLKEFSKIMEKFIHDSIYGMGLLKSNILHSPEGVYNYAKFLTQARPRTFGASCGADSDDILSLDIRGNVRLCPHTSEKFISGNINNIKGVKIVNMDLERKTNHCFSCPVKRLCGSSCPIKFPNEVFYMNCAFEKVWWGNIQLAAMKVLFGMDVKVKTDEIKQN